MYYVIGGEYTDTAFATLIPGTEECHGPMSINEALALWKGLSMHAIDNCMVRYTIEQTPSH